jgi:hypothetical protein
VLDCGLEELPGVNQIGLTQQAVGIRADPEGDLRLSAVPRRDALL